MALGARYLLNSVGAVPKTGWHIDPFGHQNTMVPFTSKIAIESNENILGFLDGSIWFQCILLRKNRLRGL
jgi:hypothetical protein